MKAKTSALLLTAAVALVGRDRPTAPTYPSPSSGIELSGRVIDFQTKTGAGSVAMEWTVVIDNVQRGNYHTTSNAQGLYRISLPAAHRYSVIVGDTSAVVYVSPPRYTTDFYVNSGDCHFWYGVLLDARTRVPVVGARVTMSHSQREAFSAPDGSFGLDLGCGLRGSPNLAMTCTGTTAWSVTHPNYSNAGFSGARAENLCALGFIRRDDFLLEPRP